MPRRRRTAKRRKGMAVLTGEQEMELLIGPGGAHHNRCFASDEERREAWELHREEFDWDVTDHPGHRPWGWWQHDSPELKGERDESETLQLLRLGVLGEDEIEALKAGSWPLYEGQAHGIALEHERNEKGDYVLVGFNADEYLEHRRYHGIPDWYDSGRLTAEQKQAVDRELEREKTHEAEIAFQGASE